MTAALRIEEREIKKYIRGKRRRETGQTHARVSPSGGAAVCEGSLVGERENDEQEKKEKGKEGRGKREKQDEEGRRR